MWTDVINAIVVIAFFSAVAVGVSLVRHLM